MNYHKNWIAYELRSWADTFNCATGETYMSDEEKGQRDTDAETYDHIHSLADKLLADTCTKDDYEEILFHLWQQKGDH